MTPVLFPTMRRDAELGVARPMAIADRPMEAIVAATCAGLWPWNLRAASKRVCILATENGVDISVKCPVAEQISIFVIGRIDFD